MITQRVMATGTFTGQLVAGAADSVKQFVTEGTHIVITTVPIDTTAFTDAQILAAAAYTGIVTEATSAGHITGYDLGWYLGTPSGQGDLIQTAVNAASAAWNLATWVSNLLPTNDLTSGTIRAGGATWTGPVGGYIGITPREALTDVCSKLSAEWRVNPAGTFDADTASVLYPTATTPTVVATAREEGQDGALRGLQGTLLQSAVDIEEYTTSVVVWGQGSGSTIIKAVANSGATTYKGFKGNNVILERFIDAPSDTSGSAATTAAAELAKSSSARRQLTVHTNTYGITRFVKHGDTVYAYDLSANLIDTANQITYRGETIPPLKVRCYGVTWPVQRGMGVYCRKWVAGVATYLDLTSQWEYETGDTVLDVGQVPAILASAAAPVTAGGGQGLRAVGAARLGVNPQIASRVAGLTNGTGAGAPAGTGNEGEWYTDTTNNRVYWSDGAGWIIMAEPVQTWATAITGLTTGNGTLGLFYKRRDGMIDVWGGLIFGSTSACTGAVTVTLPIAGDSTVNSAMFKGHALDVGVQEYPLMGASATTTSCTFRAMNSAGTYAVSANLSASIPFAWGTGHAGSAFFFDGRYPLTTRYS